MSEDPRTPEPKPRHLRAVGSETPDGHAEAQAPPAQARARRGSIGQLIVQTALLADGALQRRETRSSQPRRRSFGWFL